jgi:D-serine deaminase-like pyridoxal phosphate-dependent protein
VVVDAGLKSMAVDSGLPWIWDDGAASATLDYVAANDEHGIVMPKSGTSTGLPPLGSRMMLVPGHCDPRSICTTSWWACGAAWWNACGRWRRVD